MSHRGPVAALYPALATLAGLALTACGSSGQAPVAEDPGATSSAGAATSTDAAPSSEAASSESASSDTASDPAVEALITLDKPTDGASVSGSFDASGTANSPEANVPWQIVDASGKKVLDGNFTAEGWMDKLYPYSGSVDVSSLAPGTYTFTVSVDDEADGEGKAPQRVSRTITVS